MTESIKQLDEAIIAIIEAITGQSLFRHIRLVPKAGVGGLGIRKVETITTHPTREAATADWKNAGGTGRIEDSDGRIIKFPEGTPTSSRR